MKLFCVSDVHGFYEELIEALTLAGFDSENSDHMFVSCGDLFDRGPDPDKVLSFVLGLNPNRRIFVRGNHEDLIEQLIERGKPLSHDISNGTAQTIVDLTRKDIEDSAKHFKAACNRLKFNDENFNKYLDECVDYAEVNDYIFVHGWIPCNTNDSIMYHSKDVMYWYDNNWRSAHSSDWQFARWINGMAAWQQGVVVPDKTIVCGHWHTSWARAHIDNMGLEWNLPNLPDEKANFTVWENKGIIALDACTAYSKFVNCKMIEIPGTICTVDDIG